MQTPEPMIPEEQLWVVIAALAFALGALMGAMLW